jgi:hypothetical protein
MLGMYENIFADYVLFGDETDDYRLPDNRFVIYALGPSGKFISPDNPPQQIPKLVRNSDLLERNKNIQYDVATHIKGFVSGKKRRTTKKI